MCSGSPSSITTLPTAAKQTSASSDTYHHVVIIANTKSTIKPTSLHDKVTHFDIRMGFSERLENLKRLRSELPQQTLWLFYVDLTVGCNKIVDSNFCNPTSCSQTALTQYNLPSGNEVYYVRRFLDDFDSSLALFKGGCSSLATTMLLPIVPLRFICCGEVSEGDHTLLHVAMNTFSHLRLTSSEETDMDDSYQTLSSAWNILMAKYSLPADLKKLQQDYLRAEEKVAVVTETLSNLSNSKCWAKTWMALINQIFSVSLGIASPYDTTGNFYV